MYDVRFVTIYDFSLNRFNSDWMSAEIGHCVSDLCARYLARWKLTNNAIVVWKKCKFLKCKGNCRILRKLSKVTEQDYPEILSNKDVI